ncbi:MAG: TonB-dependent receptor, partial [Prevotella sp.]|nr:TonB-dependent receptor [Prevotella sp.]
GTVVDTNGEPVIGAAVVVKGTTVGTATDVDGKFTINAQPGKTLTFSLVGLKTAEALADDGMRVVMEFDSELLDEVMVVAYGTTKKSSFTGSAATIKGEKLEKIQTSNLSKSLEGAVAGVQTTSGSGQPGAGADIIIRGLGSISASRSPLIVLDGVPYEGSLNSISPQDIESYTILKDAAANSLYGARGSNGVIIITTKRGKTGNAIVNFEARAGFNSRGVPSYDVITDPGEYYEMTWESLRNKYLSEGDSYLTANAAASANLIPTLKYNIYKDVADADVINPATGKLNPAAKSRKWNDSWVNDPVTNGMRQEYNLNVSQGTEKSNLYASLSYLDDNGYVVNSDFKRISTRLKGEQKVGEYVKLIGAVNYTNATTNNVLASTTAYNNIFMFGQQIAPIYPIYLYDKTTGQPVLDSKGNKQYDFGDTYARPYASQQNPMATLDANISKYIVDAFTTRGSVEVTFLKDFKFTANAAYDVFSTVYTDFATPIGGDAKDVGGRGEKTTERYSALNVNQLLNYTKDIDDHHINVLLGHETKRDNLNQLYGHMTNFVDPTNPEFSNASRYEELTSAEESYALEGVFGKVDYDFDNKYYATASLRRDGSSRFHPDSRWGTFWALGASWRLSKEDFMSEIDFINELKLKASYGTQGNDNIGTWYAYKNLYEINRIDGEPATSLKFRGNSELTWEKSALFNTGFEAAVWDNRITLGVEFYIKETKDLLYAKPLAVSEGLPSTKYVNDLDMKNTGVEVELGVDIIKTNDLKWNVNLNASHYKNELTRLPSDKADLVAKNGGYQSGSYWRKVGGSIYDYYTYEYAGVDKATGKALYNVYEEIRDDNGVLTGWEKKDPTSVLSNATLRETGKSPIPDLTGGIATTVDYIGFDLSIQTAFQLGGYVMDGVYQSFMNPGGSGENFHKDMFKRWTPENTDTNVPLLLYEDQDQNGTSDRWLTDASYFSIRNITLGYSFPKKWLKQFKLEKVRIYGVADNLWYVSHRKGLDVRQSFTGAVSYAYSPIRTASLGIQISF